MLGGGRNWKNGRGSRSRKVKEEKKKPLQVFFSKAHCCCVSFFGYISVMYVYVVNEL